MDMLFGKVFVVLLCLCVGTTRGFVPKSFVSGDRMNKFDHTSQGHGIYQSNSDETCIVERLELSSQFSRWKFLQDTIEEDTDPKDVNEILFKVLKSFYDNPRPLETEDGVTNPSPTLTNEQRTMLKNKPFEINNDSGYISVLPMEGEEFSDEFYQTLDLLETLQPDPIDNEDDYKSCWDILVEMYGRESTKMAQKNGDVQFKFRSSIVRLLLHFDFLTEGIGE